MKEPYTVYDVCNIRDFLQKELPKRQIHAFGNIIIGKNITDVSSIQNTKFKIETTTLLLCNKGYMDWTINGNPYRIQANDLVLFLSGQWLSFQKGEDYQCNIIHMENSTAMEMISSIHNFYEILAAIKKHPVIRITQKDSATLKKYQLLFEERSQSGAQFKSSIAQHLCLALIYEIYSIACRGVKNEARIHNPRKAEHMHLFLKELSKSFKRERSVSYYADQLHISPKYLSSLVLEISGKQPSRWIDDYVVTEAKNLLENTRLSIQEIANQLNFCNQSVFGNYFKTHVGVSPKTYRNQEEKK